MKSLTRRVIQGIKDLAPDVTVDVVSQNRHLKLAVERPGVPRRHIAVALSPKNEEYAFRNSLNDARRALNLEKS